MTGTGRWMALAAAALPAAGLAAAAGRYRVAQTARPGARAVKPAAAAPAAKPAADGAIRISGSWQRSYRLAAGQAVEVSVHLPNPSKLPANGRLRVEWVPPQGAPGGWSKTLHALDPDVYLIYRAPAAGACQLRIAPVTEAAWAGDVGRWREKGHAPLLTAFPRRTPWPAGTAAAVRVEVKPVAIPPAAKMAESRTVIECEPNDTPELAQPIHLTAGQGITTWEVTGGGDDAEYFDNGESGESGVDWFRLDYRARMPALFTAQLSMPGQMVAARVRCYFRGRDGKMAEYFGRDKPARPLYNENKPADIEEGRDPNERSHQQDEPHRAEISRLFFPGETYYLRVESNAPGYQLQLRTLPPAPYSDPRMAIRQAVYNHIGQVDSWLTNRPRGASIERRIRDSGNLLGTNCMSCHTQSGVWGPAVPFGKGYRPENVQNYWHLINVMYECLRPTNVLKDAANNTSLAPLDTGDGPAGTRAAGFNIASLERIRRASKLHSAMQIRTANYVLQTSDPGGINAAAAGSNVGQVVVYLFATEILRTAWERTGDPRYFRALEERARKALSVEPKYTDDVAIRIDLFARAFPLKGYALQSARAAAAESRRGEKSPPSGSAEQLLAAIRAKLLEDEGRLRALQNPDGPWGFNPGTTRDAGRTWARQESIGDPSPTSLAVTALTSLGHGPEEPAIARGVNALLAMQDPQGRWNRAAITGFVTTAYALHALSRLYPEQPAPADVQPAKAESGLLSDVARAQALALHGGRSALPKLLAAANHPSRLVRYWALIGLGAARSERAVHPLLAAMDDPSKMIREAATWALRQTLLDDHGWSQTMDAAERGSDTVRAQVYQALAMRADAVMPRSRLDWRRLGALFDQGMNRDPHPAVRAWAPKAAWQWWVWNPPVRSAVNAAWVRMLERPEPCVLVENANRYSSQALFIANGHKGNGSKEHQYPQLAALFESLSRRLESLKDPAQRDLLAERLAAIGGTFYGLAGSDGGPGQMGYSTPGAGELMGRAALIYLRKAISQANMARVRAGIEGASAVPYQPLTAFLVDYSLKGPEELRQLAASAVSDPRSVSLAAVPELVGPQLEQIRRGALEPARRAQVSDPIIDLWAQVNWNIPRTEEQQRAFFDLIIPRFDRYHSPAENAAMPDAGQRAAAEREMSAAWYLADKLGRVLQSNPDLHHEIVFRRYFPERFRNPLEEHYWLRSVEWILTFEPSMRRDTSAQLAPEARRAALSPILVSQSTPPAGQGPAPGDPNLAIKDRALQLYLDQLRPSAPASARAIAIRMANKTALRTNPEVLRALSEALAAERDPELRKIIENVLKQGSEKFMPELLAALKAERNAASRVENGETPPTRAQVDDIVYFRDFVMPEVNRQKRTDQQSCVGCHGVVGRVPTMYLRPPDTYGYLPVADLLHNYRVLQSKVNLNDIERSKLLRKPLNIQDGKEDGHQGGRRYSPTDEGYLLIRKWVENQPAVQTPAPSRVGAVSSQRGYRPSDSRSIPAETSARATGSVFRAAVNPRNSLADAPAISVTAVSKASRLAREGAL